MIATTGAIDALGFAFFYLGAGLHLMCIVITTERTDGALVYNACIRRGGTDYRCSFMWGCTSCMLVLRMSVWDVCYTSTLGMDLSEFAPTCPGVRGARVARCHSWGAHGCTDHSILS